MFTFHSFIVAINFDLKWWIVILSVVWSVFIHSMIDWILCFIKEQKKHYSVILMSLFFFDIFYIIAINNRQWQWPEWIFFSIFVKFVCLYPFFNWNKLTPYIMMMVIVLFTIQFNLSFLKTMDKLIEWFIYKNLMICPIW